MNLRFYRKIQYIVLFITLFVLGISFVLEYSQSIQPCPLCLMQRFCAFCVILIGIFGVFVKRDAQILFVLGFQIFAALSGLFFSGRQIFLQTLSATHSTLCMPTLHKVMQYLSWDVVFNMFFWGSADCADMVSHWLGLSIPMWSALYFSLIVILCAVTILRVKRP